MAPIVVTPAELKTAANHIRRAHLYATQQIAGFGLVRDNGGAAGTDNAARKFCTDYDPAARDAADAATSYVIALGQFHDLLQATAANHDNANKLSVIGGAPNDLAFPPGSIAWMPRPEVPALFGGGVEPPSLWSQISGYVQGELWPNGDVEKLRNVATGWSNPGHELSANKFQLAQAREALGNQQTPELQPKRWTSTTPATTRWGTIDARTVRCVEHQRDSATMPCRAKGAVDVATTRA